MALLLFDETNEVIAYAAGELKHFLEASSVLNVHFYDETDDDPHDIVFELMIDPSMKTGSYSVASAGKTIKLSGADGSCVLQAVYDALETTGYRFEITGAIRPEKADLSALDGTAKTVAPFVLRRGIRQHINFPMDISSYNVKEACEYIRNMARIRFNHITFHSYNGQWFPFTADGKETLAGNFFYGCRHDIPDLPVLKENINNRTTFCIPEIEESLDQPQKRSDLAVAWLTKVMLQAKRCGMSVQLSIEPPTFGETENTRIVEDLVRLYPMIDVLELITPECGGELLRLPISEEVALMTGYFGEETAKDDELVSYFKDNLRQLPGVFRNVDRSLKISRSIDKELLREKNVSLVIGVYATDPDSLKIIKKVLFDHVKPETAITFLPSHGAAAAVHSFQAMDFTREQLEKTLIYSWAEFDGNMYLLQDPSSGIKALVDKAAAIADGAPVYGICLNHWRTCENKTAIDFAADLFIDPTLTSKAFLAKCAEDYGISEKAEFIGLMDSIDSADLFSQRSLFNIGFCYIDCWLGAPGLGWTRRYNTALLDETLAIFSDASAKCLKCIANGSNRAGLDFLRLMLNRIECAILHLRAIRPLSELHPFCNDNDPGSLSPEQKETVRAKCAEAMKFAFLYMEKLVENMPDRGCEGNLISYYITIPVYIDHILKVFTVGETVCVHATKKFDSPPAPFIP